MLGFATESFRVTSWCDGGGTERDDVAEDIVKGIRGVESGVARAQAAVELGVLEPVVTMSISRCCSMGERSGVGGVWMRR